MLEEIVMPENVAEHLEEIANRNIGNDVEIQIE